MAFFYVHISAAVFFLTDTCEKPCRSLQIIVCVCVFTTDGADCFILYRRKRDEVKLFFSKYKLQD